MCVALYTRKYMQSEARLLLSGVERLSSICFTILLYIISVDHTLPTTWTVLAEGAAKCLNPSIVHMVQLANQKLKQRLVSIFLYIGIVHIMPYTLQCVCHACRSVSVWVRRKLAKLVLLLPWGTRGRNSSHCSRLGSKYCPTELSHLATSYILLM